MKSMVCVKFKVYSDVMYLGNLEVHSFQRIAVRCRSLHSWCLSRWSQNSLESWKHRCAETQHEGLPSNKFHYDFSKMSKYLQFFILQLLSNGNLFFHKTQVTTWVCWKEPTHHVISTRSLFWSPLVCQLLVVHPFCWHDSVWEPRGVGKLDITCTHPKTNIAPENGWLEYY